MREVAQFFLLGYISLSKTCGACVHIHTYGTCCDTCFCTCYDTCFYTCFHTCCHTCGCWAGFRAACSCQKLVLLLNRMLAHTCFGWGWRCTVFRQPSFFQLTALMLPTFKARNLYRMSSQ